MDATRRTSTHQVTTPEGVVMTLSVEGDPLALVPDADLFLGELLLLVRAAYGDVYTKNFEEAVVDQYRHHFEREQREADQPTEYDLGYKQGLADAQGVDTANEP